jgi:hypothetical protein
MRLSKQFSLMKFNYKTFCKATKKHDAEKTKLGNLFKYKHTAMSLVCQGILAYNHFFILSILSSGFTIYNFIKEGNHQIFIQNQLDNYFTQTRNVRILIAFE